MINPAQNQRNKESAQTNEIPDDVPMQQLRGTPDATNVEKKDGGGPRGPAEPPEAVTAGLDGSEPTREDQFHLGLLGIDRAKNQTPPGRPGGSKETVFLRKSLPSHLPPLVLVLETLCLAT